MAALKYLSLITRSLIFITVLSGLLVVMFDYMNLSFTLDSARHVLIKHISSSVGRDVTIDGEIKLTVSLSPELLAQRIHIRNIDGFTDKDFITVSEVRVAASLLPLLSGELHLSAISAEQAKINLLQKKDGRHNWSFDNIAQASKPADTTADSNKTGRVTKLSLGTFLLSNVAISYSDESRDQVLETQLDRLLIDLKDITNPHAEIAGTVQGFPYSIAFKSSPLETLLTGKPWSLHGTGHIVDRKTKLEANLQLKEKALTGDIDINVANVNLGLLLDSLGIISGQDAATDNINIKTKLQGSNLIELYEQAEIRLNLGKGHWTLQSAETGNNKQLSFTKAGSFASWNKPVELHIDGNIAGKAITLDFKTNRLLEFFDEVQKLDIDLKSSIADTDINARGTLDLPVKTKQFQLDIAIKGKDLEKLNPIIDTEFPAFNDFSLTGNFIANKKGYIIKSADASVSDTQFQASIVIETITQKPLWTINLYSQQLQLMDFASDGWSIKQTTAVTTQDSSKKTVRTKPLYEPLRRLESVVKAPDMHLNLNLKVDKVLSGKDQLGKAQLQLHLRDDAINIENIELEVPGGNISSSISFEIDDSETTGHLVLDIDKLDYGITSRLFKDDSGSDGIISTRIDLHLSGSDFTRLLDKASGQIDIAVWPRNTKPAKALNLWATNLYLILLPELKKKESLVNCFVGLMNVDDGKLKEELFAIDTTKLWIYGNINVDFEQAYVNLSLFPRSKTARFFALQTPIRINGSFSKISMSATPFDLAGSYVKFITSPLHVPTRWLFDDKPPKNGSAVCEQLFDREYVEKLNAEIERQDKQDIKEMLESD